ncbi:MAG: phosphoenolpyruvate--protein phosphotransferase [Candidatus Lambdaproteobacteria bacterium RIFOXYD1_FULL_56_27]|uniref:Phosphoenolpyruvate-protein phosphotransferase n=1 Tax=Candidatus Lambdaproteobacteria bacterium RIFOXYD2_FULL_56_26 TaxID=1817773 RepID=A0A1F6H3L4_9PROT|nr:MAG: phosphoenolpyruvate--protein phosphotransferase [Candidatus Lambdaproteobacteria bacterium RIFOXYC1_FULL_56_13]OGH04916.1 MAG: phosphoenolpyruvate--protein phosphotransferase [Candidatus Lambdaproteobacteria bacterium RIFOXYD2_FULL_56_26]OGH09380.1 MAG: phosphoenolpyruvate--protein phosphotransferase [Candidatus Lambdaproteobacteria bacterium RIFOXYD1_FULL_56_27]
MMQIYKGLGVSEGVAVGKVLKIHSAFMNYPRIEIEDESALPLEVERLKKAQLQTQAQLEAISADSGSVINDELRQVLTSFQLLLADKKFVPAMIDKVLTAKINAEWALIRTIAKLEERFKKIEDPYIKARVDDIRQLGGKLMNNLLEKPTLDISGLKEPVIIVCHDISPADAFHLNKDNILGIVTEMGGMTSHSSILARAMNIPAVVGVPDATNRVLDDHFCILDGSTGEVIDQPSPEKINEKLDKKERRNLYQLQLNKLIGHPCKLKDGLVVDLAANLDFLAELPEIKKFQIPSIGLVRTEFLFDLESEFPTEEEQFNTYTQVILESSCNPITFRTWDIGSDKTTKLLHELSEEANPALGFRGIRTCLKHPEILRPQIRALLRASLSAQIKVMIPMVTRIDEITASLAIVEEERANLGIKSSKLQLGCMLETPAAVHILDDLLDLCDFISIGTNDLVQYTLAVDRLNEHVSSLYDPFHPAILKMLEYTVQTCNRRGKPVSICGEMAANPIMQMFLLGNGEITFSMSPNQVLKTKRVLGKVDQGTLKKIAFKFINKHSSDESNRLAKELQSQYVEES